MCDTFNRAFDFSVKIDGAYKKAKILRKYNNTLAKNHFD